MSSYGSWSVKGIDDRARAVAKEKARIEGVTLGDYINSLLLQGHSEAGPRDFPPPPLSDLAPEPAPQISSSLDGLMRRIESVEARSTLAITGIDQSVLGLLARLENTENNSATIAADIESMIDEVRETQEAIQSKVQQIEADDTAAENLQAMKALEQALGKLADHVYEENRLTSDETGAIKGRVEAGFSELTDRVEGMEVKVESTLSDAAARVEKAVQQSELRAEGTSRHLSERFSAIESSVATKLAKVDDVDTRMKAVEGDVSGAITSMEATLLRVQDRLNRAETTTDAALKALEQTFLSIEDRIETVAEYANPERAEALRQQFEAKFDGLAGELRHSIDETRRQLANEIEQAAAGENPELMGRLESAIGTLQGQLSEGEERSHRAIEAVIDHVGTQLTSMVERQDKKVSESEQRSAAAIEQVGEQVATAITRVQLRQDTNSKKLEDRLYETNKRQDARLSVALSNISDRLNEMQSQTISVMSPVQKAIASLAGRLESLEDFTTPPHAEKPNSELPEIPTVTASKPVELEAETPSLGSEFAEERRQEDEQFIAGISEISDEAPGDPAETPETDDEIEDWLANETVSDEDYTRSSSDRTGSDSDGDPLSALEDGRDEARDSDIFSDDFSAEFPDFADTPALPEEQSRAQDGGASDGLLEEDEDATNYLARARRAAITAAETDEQPATGRRSAASAPRRRRVATAKKGRTVPVMAAASALAVVTVGATAAYITLRGTQDAPLQPVTTASTATDIATPEVQPVAPPSLDGVAYVDSASTVEDDLFETVIPLEQGSSAPVEDLAALSPSQPLPVIPPMQTLERAALGGDPVAQFKWGESRLAANDFTTGPDFVRRAADSGLHSAQYRLAKLHEKGLGVPRDLVEARAWTEQAARGGNVKAMHDLAVFYADGDGGPQSYAAAVEWFRKAAEFGIVDSQYNLAVLYENGLGISSSDSAALYWYEIAARNGDASAPTNIAALRANLSLEEAQSAQVRAGNWQPAAMDQRANGNFEAQVWETGSRQQVLAIQTVLNGLGYDTGTPDGLAGPGTRTAIRAFQVDVGLASSGEISDPLIQALNARAQSDA